MSVCEVDRKKENGKYLKEMKEFTKKLKTSDEKARTFLVNAGIITPKGRLTRNYK